MSQRTCRTCRTAAALCLTLIYCYIRTVSRFARRKYTRISFRKSCFGIRVRQCVISRGIRIIGIVHALTACHILLTLMQAARILAACLPIVHTRPFAVCVNSIVTRIYYLLCRRRHLSVLKKAYFLYIVGAQIVIS